MKTIFRLWGLKVSLRDSFTGAMQFDLWTRFHVVAIGSGIKALSNHFLSGYR